jgi:hypothetical protein
MPAVESGITFVRYLIGTFARADKRIRVRLHGDICNITVAFFNFAEISSKTAHSRPFSETRLYGPLNHSTDAGKICLAR